MSTTIIPTVAAARVERRELGLLDRFLRGRVRAKLASISSLDLAVRDSAGAWTVGAGEAPVQMEIVDAQFFRRVATGGTLGFAESYIRGEWRLRDETPLDRESELTRLFRMFLRSPQLADRSDGGFARLRGAFARLRHAFRANSRLGSKRNIHAHYDLGNDFFRLFLDETMAYSCGVFEREDSTMEEASIAKFARLADLLDLGPDDHLLEIGTGWGGFACYAARERGCRITTTTISQEQYDLAVERIAAEGLSDRIEVRLQDYRDLDGTYDKAIAIEMIEAVGHPYLPEFFATVADRLRPGGTLALQAITMPDHRYERYLNSVDFIREYVFPGSCCPSVSAMTEAATKRSDFRLSHLSDIGPHYATTLRRWRQRFWERGDEVRAQGYPETFMRLWDYYLCYCEAGFAERYTGDVHMLLTRPQYVATTNSERNAS